MNKYDEYDIIEFLIALVLSVLAAVALYFGGGKEITWLCIAGFILMILAFFAQDRYGRWVAVFVIVFVIFAKVFGWRWFAWCFAEGMGLYGIARCASLVCLGMVGSSFFDMNTTGVTSE